MSSQLRIDLQEMAGAAIVSPRGVLDRATHGRLRTALVKAATDEPRAVVADLTELAVSDASAYALFASVSSQLAEWPGLPLLLATGPGGGDAKPPPHVRRFLPVCPSVAEAVARIDDPPPRRIARLVLPNSFAGTRQAQQFVRDVCADWDVVAATSDAMMIACELVENTLLHTYCAPSLRMELRRGLLTVAVYDDDPAPAELVEPAGARGTRGGLALVATLARTWGCASTTFGGKVVWAVMRIRDRN
ncbi:MAG TPA: ATP-binding protein [Actinophytocola sp.]|jgi:hypothetical protein|uniref:ATP-binding protein n=1 Tax=Actinophytocola sp. TaxID=1872138 RepID=UPI002F92BBF1